MLAEPEAEFALARILKRASLPEHDGEFLRVAFDAMQGEIKRVTAMHAEAFRIGIHWQDESKRLRAVLQRIASLETTKGAAANLAQRALDDNR